MKHLAAQELVSKPVTTKLIAATDEPAMVQLGEIHMCVCMSVCGRVVCMSGCMCLF